MDFIRNTMSTESAYFDAILAVIGTLIALLLVFVTVCLLLMVGDLIYCGYWDWKRKRERKWWVAR